MTWNFGEFVPARDCVYAHGHVDICGLSIYGTIWGCCREDGHDGECVACDGKQVRARGAPFTDFDFARHRELARASV